MISGGFDRVRFSAEMKASICTQSNRTDRLECEKKLEKRFKEECPEKRPDIEICAAKFKELLMGKTSSLSEPILYVFSKKTCGACAEVLEQWEDWKKAGYCPSLKIVKVPLDEQKVPKEDLPPDFPKGRINLPFIALRKPDGTWQSFKQWQSSDFGTIGEYCLYLWHHIDACQVEKQGN